VSIAFFDCFAGASGDMILGALLDAGLDPAALRRALGGLGLPGWELRIERVVKGGLAATHVQVVASEDVHARPYRELAAILDSCALQPQVKQKAAAILRRLAEVEARLHGESIEQVLLHELGGVDTLVDIAGAVVGIEMLEIRQVFVSALPMGHGTVETRHGPLPLPAPAVVELARGAPIRSVDLAAELVTPTGAAILTTLANGYVSFPPMTLQRTGCGAGQRELPIPNVLRVLIGTPATKEDAATETLVVLETNIDDMNPQVYDYVMGRLLEAGALDVWAMPIQMKKNRGGTLLSVLCRHADVGILRGIVLEETTTLGVREHAVQRHALPREIVSVETSYGIVRVKIARKEGRLIRAKPEYEDCRELAAAHQVPLLQVYREAEEEAWRQSMTKDERRTTKE
jgi:uncharacterized protein (TIGR00299 family) protein